MSKELLELELRSTLFDRSIRRSVARSLDRSLELANYFGGSIFGLQIYWGIIYEVRCSIEIVKESGSNRFIVLGSMCSRSIASVVMVGSLFQMNPTHSNRTHNIFGEFEGCVLPPTPASLSNTVVLPETLRMFDYLVFEFPFSALIFEVFAFRNSFSAPYIFGGSKFDVRLSFLPKYLYGVPISNCILRKRSRVSVL